MKNAAFGMPSDLSFLGHMRKYGFTTALVAVLAVNFFLRGGHDEQRALEIVFLMAFGVALLVRLRKSGFAFDMGPVPRWCLAGFFACGAVASACAFSPRLALFEVASFVLLGLAALVVAAELAKDGATGTLRVLQAIGFVCALYAVKVAVVYISAFAIGVQPDAGDFTPGFNNYRYFNYSQTISLPLLVGLFLLTPPKTTLRSLWLVVAAVWWALLFVTSARGTLVGLAACGLVVLALRGRHALPFLKALGLTAVAGCALYVVFFVLVPQAAGLRPFGEFAHVVDRTVADPASGRMLLWQRAFELIAQHPLLGVGPLHFAHHAVDIRIGAHPHDWVLQIAAEWGIPALLCLCGAIGAGTLVLVRTGARIPAADQRNHDILVVLIATGAAIVTDGLLSGLLVMPQSQLLIALFIGCAAGWSRSFAPARGAPAAPAPAFARGGAALVVIAAVLGLGHGAWPEIVDRVNHEPLTTQQAEINGVVYWPRLWLAGYF